MVWIILKKNFLSFFEKREDALLAESIIVDEKFLKSGRVMNKVLGGGSSPVGFGEDNNNFGNKWSEDKKKYLSKLLKDSGIHSGKNNMRAKPCFMYNLISGEETKLDYISECNKYGVTVGVSLLDYIYSSKYYFVPVGVEGCLDDIIKKYATQRAKNTYKLIKVYKSGVTDPRELSKISGQRLPNVLRFLKQIK